MLKYFLSALLLSLLLAHSPAAFGELISYAGSEREFWSNRAIVIARIETTEPLPDAQIVRLKVSAIGVVMTERLLSTNFELDLSTGRMDNAVRRDSFKAGEEVVICLGWDGAHWQIRTNEAYAFMPDGSPIGTAPTPEPLRTFIKTVRRLHSESAIAQARYQMRSEGSH